MKRLFILSLLITLIKLPSFSQTDTTFLYFNKAWETCNKDTAFYYGKVYKVDKLWARKDFWKKGDVLQMEGTYLEKECKAEQGLFTWYKENGTKDYSSLYEKGDVLNKTFYHENGKKKGFISYADKIQQGWDEQGNEIKNYIVEKEAKARGSWKTYLERTLNPNVAADAGAPAGQYTVKVQFVIDKEGYIKNVVATSVPANCRLCGIEAVNVISNGPQWEPAIQNGRPVIYQAIQHVTFQVVEETKRKKRFF